MVSETKNNDDERRRERKKKKKTSSLTSSPETCLQKPSLFLILFFICFPENQQIIRWLGSLVLDTSWINSYTGDFGVWYAYQQTEVAVMTLMLVGAHGSGIFGFTFANHCLTSSYSLSSTALRLNDPTGYSIVSNPISGPNCSYSDGGFAAS